VTFESTNALFRAEALSHREQQLAGTVLAIGTAWRVGAVAACVTCLAVIAGALSFATYASRQTVGGNLAPVQGVVKIYAARPGIIHELMVRDGELVAAQQRLAVISVDRGYANAQGASAPDRILEELTVRESSLSASVLREEDLTTAQDGRLGAKARELHRQLAGIGSEIALLEKRIASAQDLVAGTEKLKAQGFATPIEVNFRKDHVLTLQKEWYALTRSETALATELSDVQLQQRQLPSQLQQRQLALKNQLSEIRQQKAAFEVERTYAVTAPSAGRVTALQAEPGALAVPGQPLMVVVPDGVPLEARLLVPSRAIGFVRPGQRVRMRYSAFPHEQYGVHEGTVKEVSRVSLRPEEAPASLPANEAMYRVTVGLASQHVVVNGRPQALQPSMSLEADLLEEPRALWQWIFRPILAVRGNL
jgi:membrane fusion protein